MLETLIAILLVVGATFTLIGSIGLARLPDFYTRLHGPTKATTLGVGSMLLASVLYFSTQRGAVSLHELLITIFLFMTAPVSGHLMAKAGLHLRVPNVSGGPEQIPAPGMDDSTHAGGPVGPEAPPRPPGPAA
jgi:multicomponent K+:H+ antiporter subunit G